MSALLLRLRQLDPSSQPNAALLEAIRGIDLRNRDIQAAMLRGLDEQDELALHYQRLTQALLERQGRALPPVLTPDEPSVHNVTLTNGWN